MDTGIDVLQQTASLHDALRAHFRNTNALEVHTPCLSGYAVTDPNIHSLSSVVSGRGRVFLHTSPEYSMKRLLAAGSGDIYQICTVFRDGEQGRLHNPEFKMCEWYRVNADHLQLMQEVDGLLQQLWTQLAAADNSALGQSDYISYAAALESATGLVLADLESSGKQADLLRSKRIVQQKLEQNGVASSLKISDSLDDWLDLTMAALVFPGFARDRFTFLYDYPASQAALARTGLNSEGDRIAQRFEVFFGSIELANGFHELRDAEEQQHRFEQDLARRAERGLALVPMDKNLLLALDNGFPDCAGVALGLDRLQMVLQRAEHISQTQFLKYDEA